MSGILNLQINALAFQDLEANNNPKVRNFDLVYQRFGLSASKAKSDNECIPPGVTQNIFDGTRTTLLDGTTQFDVTKPDPTIDVFRYTYNNVGTDPILRTERATGIDTTTELTLTKSGSVITLTNSAGTSMSTAAIVVGDILKIEVGSGFNPANRGTFTIIAKTASSISIQNLDGTAEVVVIADTSKFLVYSNGASSNQIQINDKVVISAGFSSVTFGTFSIVEVTSRYFEIAVSQPNDIPLETGIAPGATGLVFYTNAKIFILIAAQDRCSIQINGSTAENILLEPTEVGNPEKPALYVQTGTVYSLSVKNLSLSTLDLVIATTQ